jgi:hypothetical protein
MPFFLLKGLSFLPGAGLLKNPKVILALILIAALVFGYFKWKGAIEDRIYQELHSEQIEAHLEQLRQESERMVRLAEESQRAIEIAQIRRNKLIREIEAARDATRNVKPEDNGPVAPVLKDALDFIRSRQPTEAPVAPADPSLIERVTGTVKDAVGATEEAATAVTDKAKITGNSAIDAWRKLRNK